MRNSIVKLCETSQIIYIMKEENDMERSKKSVVIPIGVCCAYCCGDYGSADPSEKDSNGKIWCSRNHAYYYKYESSSGCSGYFTRK